MYLLNIILCQFDENTSYSFSLCTQLKIEKSEKVRKEEERMSRDELYP